MACQHIWCRILTVPTKTRLQSKFYKAEFNPYLLYNCGAAGPRLGYAWGQHQRQSYSQSYSHDWIYFDLFNDFIFFFKILLAVFFVDFCFWIDDWLVD